MMNKYPNERNFLKKIFSSSLLKNSFIYVLCDGINRAIPFFLLHFLTKYLTPSDYGVVTNFNILVQIFSVFCFASVGALPVMFNKLEKEEVKLYGSSMVLLNVFVLGGFIAVIILFNPIIKKFLQISLSFQMLALINTFFFSITNFNMVLWRCEENPVKFGVYQISQTTVNVLSTIILVIILSFGWRGRVYSMVLSTALFGFLSLFILIQRGYFVLKISKRYMKEVLFFSLPLIPHALSFWLKSGVDKILLTNMSGLNENGLYSVAMTWAGIVSMFAVSFSNAYAPYLYKRLSLIEQNQAEPNEPKKLVKMIYSVIGLAFFLVFVFYWISALFIKIVYAPSYQGSLIYLPYIMIGQFFNICYLLFVCFVHYTLKTKILGIITFSLSLLQIALSYISIKLMGPVGVAVSSMAVMALTFIFVAHYGMKVYKLPWLSFKRGLRRERV